MRRNQIALMCLTALIIYFISTSVPVFGEETDAPTLVDISSVFEIPENTEQSFALVDIDEVFTTESLKVAPEEETQHTPVVEQKLGPRDLYKQAAELIQRKRREEAKKVLYTLIEDFPDSPIAPGVLYQIALLENDLTTKVSVLNRLVETYPESSWSEVARYKIAETYFIGGKYKEALNAFLRYTTEHPGAQYESRSMERSAECYMRLGNYRQALKQYDKLFATFSDTLNRPEIFDAVAECYILVNKIDEAVKVLDYAVKTFPNYPNNPSMYLSLFLCGEEQGNRKISQQAYTALTQSYPNSFHADVARSYLKKTRKPFFEM